MRTIKLSFPSYADIKSAIARLAGMGRKNRDRIDELDDIYGRINENHDALVAILSGVLERVGKLEKAEKCLLDSEIESLVKKAIDADLENRSFADEVEYALDYSVDLNDYVTRNMDEGTVRDAVFEAAQSYLASKVLRVVVE